MKYLFIISVLLSQLTQKGCGDKQSGKIVPGTTDIPHPQEMVDKGEPVISMEKTYCFGTCPVFKAYIYPSGFLYYEGIHNVADSGKHVGQVPQGSIEKIMKAAEATGFFEMADSYDNEHVTDLPSTIISIRKKKQVKTVLNRYQGPKEFKRLEEAISEVIASSDLKPLPEKN